MKKYLGIKIIEGEPMNLGDYNKHKGWMIPDDEDPLDAGYLLKYTDGYVSWSPAMQFESAYDEFDDAKPFSSYGKIILNKYLSFLTAMNSTRERAIAITMIEQLQLWVESKL